MTECHRFLATANNSATRLATVGARIFDGVQSSTAVLILVSKTVATCTAYPHRNCYGSETISEGAYRFQSFCAAKRKARGGVRGWRSPPPPRRERKAAERPKFPEVEILAGQEGKEGKAEVEMGEEEGPG